MKKTCFALLAFLLVSPFLLAQPIRGLTTAKKIKVAEEQLSYGNIYNALEWYEKAYEDDNSNLEVIFALADLQNQLRDYVQAEKWFSRLVRKDKSNEYPLAKFWLGQVLKKNGKFEDAVTNLQEYVAGTSDEKYKTLASNEILGAEMAKEMENSDNLLEVKNIGETVNSPSTEMSAIYRDGETMLFSALPNEEVKLAEEAGFAKIFMSARNPDGSWGEGVPLSPDVNTGHSVHPALSADGSTLYFTRCEMEGNFPKKCDIFMSKSLGSNEWELAKKVEGINVDDASTKQPAVATINGQEALVFASDRSGGQGGFDIYYAVQNRNGSFDAPVNAGATVNTIGDEETPFFHDNTLYFSSNGHPTMGGFDVFSASWQGAEYGNVQNMKKGVNSTVDDLYFSLDEGGFSGFVVSNRPGTISLKSETCCDDIFSLDFYIPLDIVGLTFNSETREDLNDATMKLYKINKDKELTDEQTNKFSNEFSFKNVDRDAMYMLVATKEGYFPDSTEIATTGKDKEIELKLNLLLKPIPVEPEPEFDYVYILLDTIYYDFDKFNIRDPDASSTLNNIANILQQYPVLVVEVASHTDALGTNSYNDILAERRTASAVKYLEEVGIPQEQLVPMSYGELRPIAPNRTADGKDDPEGRQKNRRTEFRVLSGTDEQGRIKIPLKPKGENTTGSIETPSPVEDILKDGIAKLTFNESFFDFGTLKEGETRKHTFVFQNTGDVPLLIEFASGSCGCTVPEWPEDAIAPGGSGSITVEYNSKGKTGVQNQEINIIANTDPIVTELKIKAEVLASE